MSLNLNLKNLIRLKDSRICSMLNHFSEITRKQGELVHTFTDNLYLIFVHFSGWLPITFDFDLEIVDVWGFLIFLRISWLLKLLHHELFTKLELNLNFLLTSFTQIPRSTSILQILDFGINFCCSFVRLVDFIQLR